MRYDGRVYLPQDRLTAHNVTLEDLRGREVAPRLKAALREYRDAVQEELQSALASASAPLRPLAVLAALHRRLLDRIAAHDYDVATSRIELGPIEKPWVAWRTARKLIEMQCIIVALLLLSGCAAHPVVPADSAADWHPTVATPQFAPGAGPRVLVDAAHGNFHTIDGRFAPFAALLRADGYRVAGADQPITPALLATADVFVIANAVKGGENAEWVLPTPPALEPEEVAALAAWVHDGGSLLLIADHMPFPGSVADLADAFGIVFLNGYAKKSVDEGGTLIFTRAGGLADHPIVRGRNAAEEIAAIKAFTGQAFRAVVPVEPLMRMPPDWAVFFPHEAGEFTQHDACGIRARPVARRSAASWARPRGSVRRGRDVHCADAGPRRPGRHAHGHERSRGVAERAVRAERAALAVGSAAGLTAYNRPA